jgi:hypothetical protein
MGTITAKLTNGLVLLVLCLGLIQVTSAAPTYDQQILKPDSLVNNTVQFPCAISVAHSGLGAVTLSRDTTANTTVILVLEKDADNLWVTKGEVIVDMALDLTVDADQITCSAAIEDSLERFVVSIATNTPSSATNPAMVRIFMLNDTTYSMIQELETAGNVSQAKAVAMSADGETIYLSEPASVFNASRIRILTFDANASTYNVSQDIEPAVNVSSLGASWTEDIAASTDGNVFIANSPYAPHIYIFAREDSLSNFTFVDRLSINTTTAAFTSIALAGVGEHIFATYDFDVEEVDNSTTRHNGVYRWSYDGELLAWDPVPSSITYGVGTLNTTTDITTYNYSRYIHSPVSACSSGNAIVVSTYVADYDNTENITFTSLSLDATSGLWIAEDFPLPTFADWLLSGVATVQEISSTLGSGIGFNRILSDLGDLALVPTQQSNNTEFAYWISSYTGVADCSDAPIATPVDPVPSAPTAVTGNTIATAVIASAAVAVGFVAAMVAICM